MGTEKGLGVGIVITRRQGTHAWCMGCRWFRCDNACGLILLRCMISSKLHREPVPMLPPVLMAIYYPSSAEMPITAAPFDPWQGVPP